MKKHLLLPTLSLSMVVPMVSCVPMTIQNNNEEISNWNDVLVKIKDNKEVVKEIEAKLIQQAFNKVILPLKWECGRNDEPVDLFNEICKVGIIVNKEDFTYPEYTINEVYTITLNSFKITNIPPMWIKALFAEEISTSINEQNVFTIKLDTPLKFKSIGKFWEGE